jgi:hypothetical protein
VLSGTASFLLNGWLSYKHDENLGAHPRGKGKGSHRESPWRPPAIPKLRPRMTSANGTPEERVARASRLRAEEQEIACFTACCRGMSATSPSFWP